MWWLWTAVALAGSAEWPVPVPEPRESKMAVEWRAWPDGLPLPVPLEVARVRWQLHADQLTGVLTKEWCTAELRDWPLATLSRSPGSLRAGAPVPVPPVDGPCLLARSPVELGAELTGTLASPYAFAEATLPARATFSAVRRDGAWHLIAAEATGDAPIPVEVEGVPLDLRLRVWVSGLGLAGRLAAPHPFAEATLPAGASFSAFQGDDGWHLRNAHLAGDTPVPVQVGDLSMDLRTELAWTDARRLGSGALAAPAQVAGLPLAAGPIGWYGDQLSSGTLGAPLTRGRLELPAGAAFEGRLDSSPRWTAPPGAPIRYGGLLLTTATLCLDVPGCEELELVGALAAPGSWGEVPLAGGTAVALRGNALQTGTLGAAAGLRGVALPAGTTLSGLDDDGLRLVPPAQVTAGGLTAAAGEELDLDPDGRPLKLILAAPATIAGLRLPAGALLGRADGAHGWSAGVMLRAGELLVFDRFEAGEPLPDDAEHPAQGPGWWVSYTVDMEDAGLSRLAWLPDGGEIERPDDFDRRLWRAHVAPILGE